MDLIDEACCQLLRCQKEFQEGNDAKALLEAIHVCCSVGLPLPPWTAEAYSRSYLRFRHFHARSLDEAFGSPRQKGTHLAQKKDEQLLQGVIYWAVRKKRMGGRVPIDETLFASIGKEHGISSGKCRRIYYEAKRLFEADSQPGDDEFLQNMRFMAKAPDVWSSAVNAEAGNTGNSGKAGPSRVV